MNDVTYVAFSKAELEAIAASLKEAVSQLHHTRHCICPACRALDKAEIWSGQRLAQSQQAAV